jgi:hypothetical protein
MRVACLGLLALTLAFGCASTPSTASTEPEAQSNQGEAFVSRSGGEPGGLVVFWPRVIPRSEDPEVSALAKEVQDKLVELARATFPDRPIDVRPEPERVCPREGCAAATFGALLVHKDDKCIVVALVSTGATDPTQLAVWGGDVEFKQELVPFREHPEDHVAIHKYVACDELLQSMASNDESVVGVLRATSE